MGVVKLLLAFSIFGVALKETSSHGMLWDPINRSSAWKKHFRTPRNDNDNQLYCGGMTVIFIHFKRVQEHHWIFK